MIIRIELRGDNLITLPKNYNQQLQAFFYKNMDRTLSKFLHDIGFVYGKRRFKLFTFSKIIGKLAGKDLRKGTLTFEPEITLYFASPLMDIVSSSVKNFIRKEELYIGRNRVYLQSVEAITPEVEEEITVRCLSPITVYKTPPGQRKHHYLTPWQEEFYELLKKNLIKKYELLNSKSFGGSLDIEPVKINNRYKKKIVYKGTLIEAWEGYFKLRGNRDILRIALEAGLGAKNSVGFGMVERVM